MMELQLWIASVCRIGWKIPKFVWFASFPQMNIIKTNKRKKKLAPENDLLLTTRIHDYK